MSPGCYVSIADEKPSCLLFLLLEDIPVLASHYIATPPTPSSVPTWGRGVKFCLEGDGSSGQIWRRWQTKLGFGHHHNFPHLSWHPTLPIPDIKCWKTRKPWYFYCEPPCVRNATTYYHCVRETHLRKMWRHQIRARALFTDAWCPSNQVYYIISKVNLSKKLQREKHLMGLSILFWLTALSFWEKGNFESILAGSGIFFSQFSPWSADWAWKRHKIGHSVGSRGISKEAFNNQPRGDGILLVKLAMNV